MLRTGSLRKKLLSSCWSLSPVGNEAPHSYSPNPHLPTQPGRMGRGIKAKVMTWNRNSLIGKAKSVHNSKANQWSNSLLPIGSATSRRAGPHHVQGWLRRTNTIPPNVLRLPPSSPHFMSWPGCQRVWNVPLVILCLSPASHVLPASSPACQ